MEIRNLKDTPLPDIVSAISESFADYFVPMPDDVSFWEKRFRGARVNFELSFGMFQNGKLNGFIINGIDDAAGLKTAFNTGTGVTQDARGQGVTERIYEYALPVFREQGIEACSLEVIEQNERAIHVYSRIGFRINKRLKCFKGNITAPADNIKVTEVDFQGIETLSEAADHYYSWDNTSTTIKASGNTYKFYKVYTADGQEKGFFVINPETGYVAQFESLSEATEDALQVLAGIATIAGTIKINNVDADRTHIVSALTQAGLENFIDQYEMKMPVA